GRILVPYGSNIIIDLNGNSIDRGLTKDTAIADGNVIIVDGKLAITDNGYNWDLIKDKYDNFDNSTSETKNEDFIAEIDALDLGRITGGANLNRSGCIYVNENGCLDIFGGTITNNFTKLHGGAVFSDNAIVNFSNGIISNNTAHSGGGTLAFGGGVYMYGGVMNYYDGLMINNTSFQDGGAIYLTAKYGYSGKVISQAVVNMYNGIICLNNSSHGAGIYSMGGELIVNDGIISYNKSSTDGGGLYVRNIKDSPSIANDSQGKITINNGLIYRNIAMYGGGIQVDYSGYLIINDCKIFENEILGRASSVIGGSGIGIKVGNVVINKGEIINNKAVNSLGIIRGCGIVLTNGNAMLTMYGGVISGNIISGAESQSQGAGISKTSDLATINIYGGVQIFGNKLNNTDSDVYLTQGQKLNILSSLVKGDSVAHIGISLASNYEGEFTYKYNSGNNNINPARYFYSNNTNYPIVLSENKEAMLDITSTSTKPTASLTWKWTGGNNGSTTQPNYTVTYTGNPFRVSATGTIYYNGTGQENFDFTEVGSYALCSNGNYINPTFVFTILPKEVDIIWSNTNLTYNGSYILPTASISEDSSCSVTVVGESINVGNNYVATATALSNKNYKIKSKTKNITYSIMPKDLEITIQTQDMEKEYTGKNVEVKDS
ncbi:MAG: hypothetical protein K2P12_02680, partial [Clostridia bacterium]|nr:hypothetical protein [Clostridia bacterium]